MTRELHEIEGSVFRQRVDPEGVLPTVAFLQDDRADYHRNTERFLLVDITHGGAGEATVVHSPAGERYFTRLEVFDKHLDQQVRLAAYLLAIEDGVLRHGEGFINDRFAEREADVEVWKTLAAAGVAEIADDFTPMNYYGGNSASGLYVGQAQVIRP